MSELTTALYIVDLAALVFVCVASYAVLVKIIFSLLRLSSYAETMQNSPHERLVDSESMMPVSLLLADCDTDHNVADTVRSLLQLDFPEYEVVAVCDGERTDALKKLIDTYEMVVMRQPIKRSVPMWPVRAVYRSPAWPGLIVVDKHAAGRHDALNAGVNVSRYPLVFSLQPGCRLTGEALAEVATPFMRNFGVVAVGGLPRIGRYSRGVLAHIQQVEYLRDFPAGIAVPGQEKLPLIPGAFGAFRKATLIAEGGFARKTGEAEMVVRLYRKNKKQHKPCGIEILPDPVYQAKAPRRLWGLFLQRRVWQREIMAALGHNMGMFLNPRYGRGGMADMPGRVLFDVVGPVLELVGCIVFPVTFAMGLISLNLFLLFLAFEVLFSIVNSLAAVISQQILESDNPSLSRLCRMIIFSILGSVGYRQLLLIFRVAAMLIPRPR